MEATSGTENGVTMESGTPAIDVRDLSKHYGAVRAVDDISFSVGRGEIFGLLGHNGAGKTTTIRMMTGRTVPTSGAVRIGGFDAVSQLDEVKPLINLVFEDQNLYERMSGYDNLKFFAELYNAPSAKVDALLDRVALDDEARKRKVKTYSSGMKQRLLIARALINDPQILFLDEPTRGLDPASARELRQIVREMAEHGTTVVLCTHYMEEADELCDRVAFLASGKIVALDTPTELKLRYGTHSAQLLLADRSTMTVDLSSPEDAGKIEALMAAGQILTIHSQEGTLEDVFVNLAGRPLS
ncbi:MAG: ABC transporter ATP-binding protein [Thermomicrobiales bacterium]|nr:ABC transporter ATP-binding protein [Thermomicrobiales bacterium]